MKLINAEPVGVETNDLDADEETNIFYTWNCQ
jgi:hypothetical protein